MDQASAQTLIAGGAGTVIVSGTTKKDGSYRGFVIVSDVATVAAVTQVPIYGDVASTTDPTWVGVELPQGVYIVGGLEGVGSCRITSITLTEDTDIVAMYI